MSETDSSPATSRPAGPPPGARRGGRPTKQEPVDDCAALILAAGASSRFGSPKPLAYWNGSSLVARAVETAEAAGCWPIAVVVGCEAAAVAGAVPASAAIVVNPRWAEGQGTSLAAGVDALTGGYEPGRTLILPVDLPHLSADDLKSVIEASKRDGAAASAASFPDGAGGEASGPPVCVLPQLYPALRNCTPGGGAKPILAELGEALVRVPLPAAADDADTPADLNELAETGATA